MAPRLSNIEKDPDRTGALEEGNRVKKQMVQILEEG